MHSEYSAVIRGMISPRCLCTLRPAALLTANFSEARLTHVVFRCSYFWRHT